MMTKEQSLSLSGALATASITAVGLAIGGSIGAVVMAGIGINLSSTIIQAGCTNLKEKWLYSSEGILNHDIQQALVRAFIKSLASLEKRYFALEETKELPNEKREDVKSLFRDLKGEAQKVFLPSIEKTINDQEMKSYLYDNPQEAKNAIWKRIDSTNIIYTYYGDHIKNFLRDNFLEEVIFWFGEELKTDSKECNKAWRAFQRMLLEGIQEDVKAVQASQDVIHRDLQTLNIIQEQLDHLRDTIDHRLPDEPFQESFAKSLIGIQTVLDDVAKSTQRIEERQDHLIGTTDIIAADVKKLLGEKAETEAPEISDDVMELFDEGLELRNLGKYEEARTVFQKALELARSKGDRLAAAEANRYQAVILKEWDKDSEGTKALLEECLREFKEIKDERRIAKTLFQLGWLAADAGNLDQAEAYLFQALELDKKNDEKIGIASTLQQLGRIRGERGNYREAIDFEDQALKYYLSIYQDGDSKKEKDLLLYIAGCYQNKGLAYENLGNVEEVETNYMRALEWHRKTGYKLDMGRLLFLLARLKFREGQYNEGSPFLDEATEIYTAIGDDSFLARCLDLKGRLLYTLGQIDEAISVFESVLAVVERAEDYAEQDVYLSKLGQIYLKDKKQSEQAKNFFERARELSLRKGLLEGYAEAVQNLAQVAHIENNNEERDKLLSDGIQTLEKLLLTVQAKPKRAFLMGQIGFFYERMENFQQALIYYHKAKKSFESISDIGGLANCLGSIARIKGLLGKKDEEFDTYRDLKRLVDGTPYYVQIAGTAINLGEINIQIGNLDEAKMMFQEAEFLCRKYNLPFADFLKRSVKRLNELIGMRKPPELSFEQLIEELFELIDWFPEAKDGLLRLWLSGRAEMFLSNVRILSGIKFMLCQDDPAVFFQTSEHLSPYSDLCLQVVSTEYPGIGLDIVPFPLDKKMFFGNRYEVTSNMAESKLTGKGGAVLVGWTTRLPDQAHQMILSRTAADIIDQRSFFLPYQRHLINDKLLNDLSFFGKGFGLIPVYFDLLPVSENVAVLHSARINLPILSADDVESQRRQIRKVKHALTQLLSVTRGSSQSSLNNFVFEVEELAESYEGSQSIQMQIYILEFPSGLDKELHIAMVINDR